MAGLVRLAANEEQLLLTSVDASIEEPGGPDRWAAQPVVAHNTEFKQQQVVRLAAVANGEVPPDFAEVDHSSAELYHRYAAQSLDVVRRASRHAADDLIDHVDGLPSEDLIDPSRHPWLRGRLLFLQVIVRGFWHPTGHLGEYYLAHGAPERALELHHHAVATADDLGAPDPARGMARYTLACVYAGTDQLDDALRMLTEAVMLNSDLRSNVARDHDLAALRVAGRLDQLV